MSLRFLSIGAGVALLASLPIAACIQAQPPTDTGDPVLPTAPSSSTGNPSNTSQGVAYDPDVKAILAADCVACHGGFRLDGNYSVTTYQNVMRDVRPGDAASRLVVVAQPSGSMYRYWSGTTSSRQAKANMIFLWVVANKAAQTR